VLRPPPPEMMGNDKDNSIYVDFHALRENVNTDVADTVRMLFEMKQFCLQLNIYTSLTDDLW
jgi:hypothetical protein